MHSTSKKVKLSILSPSGEVKSTMPSLSQIHLAHIALEKEKVHKRTQEGTLLL